MKRDDINDDWPLVVWHRERVLEIVHEISTRCRTQLRFDRAALIDAYSETQDLQRLALTFGVSLGAITDALGRLIRIARQVEYRTLLGQAADGCAFVVLVPVSTRDTADRLAATLDDLGFDATVDELRFGR